MKNLLISFSGGRTSAYMTKLILENDFFKDYKKIVCFANTGKELEHTLEFVNRCDKEFNFNVVWIEADVVHEKQKGTKYKVVDFETASRNGEPFEEVIKKYGLPSKLYRHCTRELKEVPIHKYAKEIFGSKKYLTAVGIRADETHRVTNNSSIIYPLVQANVDEKFIRSWWDNQSFDLELKDYEGNCDLCFLKSVRKKRTIIKENPNTVDWWLDIEKEYGEINEKGIDRTIFDIYRELSIEDLIELASKPFNIAKDKHDISLMQSNLFDIDLDEDFDCFCKG